jgi:hypothetical protein
MDQWAVVLPSPTPEAFPPPPAPGRRRPGRTTFAVLGAVLLLVLGCAWWVRRPGALADADRPGAQRLPLGVLWKVRDPAVGSAYEIRFPVQPHYANNDFQPLDKFALLATVKIERGAYVLLGRFGDEVPRDARASLVAMEKRNGPGSGSGVKPNAPMRTTRVGDVVAYAQDYTVGVNGNRLTEYRFKHAGRVYSAAILLWPTATEQDKNTALAVLRTLRWTA